MRGAILVPPRLAGCASSPDPLAPPEPPPLTRGGYGDTLRVESLRWE